MKYKIILLALILIFIISSCSDVWNKHYDENYIEEGASDLTLAEYLEKEPSYSKYYNLLKDADISSELSKNQYLTLWAVNDDNFDISGIGNIDPAHVAKYHINYLAFRKANLKEGLRIQTFNGIYLTINDNGNLVNTSKILSSKSFKNGVIYEIDKVLVPLINMFDYISLLDDDYSIIRDSILHSNINVFDRKNSIPIGVDNTGNTVYDSVFYVSNPLFEKADFSSEFNQFTMFLPNNNVVEQCFNDLQVQYDLMGKPFQLADTLLAMKWIKEAIFHEGEIDNYGSELDLKSPFGRVWRTSIQKIDNNSKKVLSNGQLYEVEKLKIPNNVIVDRVKSLVYYYGFCDEQEKDDYYIIRGARQIKVTQGDQSPVSGFYYWLMEVAGNDGVDEEFSVEFTPLAYDEATDKVSVVKVPPGEYNLYMGFRSAGHPYVDVYFNSGNDTIPEGALPVGVNLPASQSSPWNYDRVNETDPLISKWNGLGGLVGVVNVDGDEMSTFRIKVQFNQLMAIGAAKRMQIYHWALKPTSNNY